MKLIVNGEVLSRLTLGDSGIESTGINIGGTTYQSTLKVSDIDGTNLAQNIFHRHSTTIGPAQVFARSNSNTSAHAAVTVGQDIGSIYAAGYAGTSYKLFGSFVFSVGTGTVSETSAPGKLTLSLSPDGSISLLPVLTALSSGNIGIGTTTPSSKLTISSSSQDVVLFLGSGNSITKSEGLSGFGSFYAKGSGTNNSYIFFGDSGGEKSRITSLTDGTITISNGTSAIERFRINSTGGIVCNTSAIATTATTGFFWITSCPGTPTGAPTSPYTNAAALVVDTTNSRLYVLVGSTWKYTTLI